MLKTGELHQVAESLAGPSIWCRASISIHSSNRLELPTGAIQGHPAKKGRGRQKRRPNWDSRNYRPGTPDPLSILAYTKCDDRVRWRQGLGLFIKGIRGGWSVCRAFCACMASLTNYSSLVPPFFTRRMNWGLVA